jgi:TetR/AcrR family transcriptional repressor of nem operon
MARPSLREKIIESGVNTVHERGFNASGIRDITGAAGVPQGSFTNHFRSKEDFGVAVLDRYLDRTEAIMAATLCDQTRAPADRLRAYFDVITEALAGAGWRHGCLISNMSLEAADHSELIRARLVETFGSLTHPFTEALLAAQTAGEIRDDIAAADLADVLLSTWHGAMLRMKVERSPEPLDRFRRIFLEMLIVAQKKEPGHG